MRLGTLNELISETSDFPGSIGDSAHNTARQVVMVHSLAETGKEAVDRTNPYVAALKAYRTPTGYVRHWDAPADWRETDTTTDMLLPLYLAYKKVLPSYAEEMKQRIKDAGWKSGNGDFISPGFYGVLNGNQWMVNESLWIQSLFFKFPYRWSDSKKWFEKSNGSSADYLNWVIMAAECGYPWTQNLIDKEKLHYEIGMYFGTEPNNGVVVAVWEAYIEKNFRRRK